MPDAEAVKAAQHEFDKAVQVFTRETLGNSGIVLDWVLSLEQDDGEGHRTFWVLAGPTMTAWKLWGFAQWASNRMVNMAKQFLG